MNSELSRCVSFLPVLALCIAIATVLLPFANESIAATAPPPATANATVTPIEDLPKLTDGDLEKRIQEKLADRARASQAQWWTPELIKFLTLSVLIFGILIIIIMAILVLNHSSAGEVLRLFTVPLVIVAAVFLVVTGYSQDQITPVIGLLGTLAGYILGVQSQKTASQTPASSPPQPPPPNPPGSPPPKSL
jgi:hypothetical protein